MIPQMKWIERSFRSDLQIGVFPGIVEHDDHHIARITALARILRDEIPQRGMPGL